MEFRATEGTAAVQEANAAKRIAMGSASRGIASKREFLIDTAAIRNGCKSLERNNERTF